MNWSEHNPPHFHVEYGNYKAAILIQEGVISAGYLPKRQLKFVLAWAEIHNDELMQNWELAKANERVYGCGKICKLFCGSFKNKTAAGGVKDKVFILEYV